MNRKEMPVLLNKKMFRKKKKTNKKYRMKKKLRLII